MFIEIRKINRLQKDGTCTYHAKQWPTPPNDVQGWAGPGLGLGLGLGYNKSNEINKYF